MSSGDNTGERNPFAPPPADAPDQPWQPRTPRPGEGPERPDGEGAGEHPQVPPPHPWGPGPQGGDGWQPRPPAPQPPRLDPTDPAQRKARNAALAGLFALICVLAGFHWVALFVGALGILWGITAMRAPKPSATDPVGIAPSASNPLTPAALSGILTGAMTVMVASSVIGLGLYYQDYVTCVQDSLTSVGADNCSRLAPQWYVDLVGNGN
ncbi:hypothetical protein [Kitasatospora aureofaciens]|uniref:hypothetical protein n=1 Tax=Kitasatospora aureofaciens TaxID=1894 RepID=UPI001C48A92E|nr:hypothetical protein [Kitasatospora aureofaciens]MBV6696516.1 hypothetical protein [Kitasatospora aureofaciens]